MTISKKESRKIIINGETYRWVISPDSGFIVLVAEHEEVKGRRIEVYIHSDINEFWVNFPDAENLNLRVIKPNNVRFIISQALQKGWHPKEKGAPIVFNLDGNLLLKR